jgi:SNF2 family DNA or RNA helicase
MANAEDAELVRLPKVLPELFEFVSGRPYQRADIKFMVECKNPLNANAPSLGKTFETLATIFEADLDRGPQLIIAPVTSLELVWQDALETWQPHPVLVCLGSPTRRAETLGEAKRLAGIGKPFWLVLNPAMLMLEKVPASPQQRADLPDEKYELDAGGHVKMQPKWPIIEGIRWNTVVIDEFHKCGLANKNTATRKGIKRLQAQKKIALSGTPIGGKTRKLWGVLNYLEPKEFSSEWRWIDQWLDKSTNRAGYTEVGDLREDRVQEFYKTHAQYMVRRTKEEARKDIGHKVINDIWCHMGPKQAAQYKKFAADAEVRIEEEMLSATSILAEYTRLRQFAVAEQTMQGDTPYPTQNSCKLDMLKQILSDHGITGDAEAEGQERVVVFSQFSKVIDMVTRALCEAGIAAEALTGDTKQADRTRLVRAFEGGELQVLAMTTTAGGTAITLNSSTAVVFLDETFNPDDQEQAEDRNRNNTAVIYYLRTRGTIEEHVLNINTDKKNINKAILDARRKGPLAL